MPFGFPPSPTLGQLHPVANPLFQFNGVIWEPLGGSGVPGTATPVTTVKPSPAGADLVILLDSAASFAPVLATLASLPGGGGAGELVTVAHNGGGASPMVGDTLAAVFAAGYTGTVQWQRDGTNIAGATALTYLTVLADANVTVRPQVTSLSYTATGLAVGSGEPAAMTTGQWTLAPIAGGLRFGIVTAPAGTPTSYQYSTDNGATWTTLSGGAALGTRDITGLAQTPYQSRVRAVNGVGPAPMPGSDTKTETPLPAAGRNLNFVRASAVRAGDFGSDATLTFPSSVAVGNHVLAAFFTDSQSRNFSGTGAILDATNDQSTAFRGQGLRIPAIAAPGTVFPFALSSGWNFSGAAIEVSGNSPVPAASFGNFDASISGAERVLPITVAVDNSIVLLVLAPQDDRTWTWGGSLTGISNTGYAPMAWAKLNAGAHSLTFTPSNTITLNGFCAFVWSPGP